MFQIGIGIQDITPPVGLPLGGFIARENRPSTHIDSRLYLRCLAIRAEDELSFLFNADLLGLGHELTTRIQGRLAVEFGDAFSPQRSLLTTTHTHSAPVVIPLSGESEPDERYQNVVVEAAVCAARSAFESLQPASLSIATLRMPGLTYNRRSVLVDGRVSISLEPDLPVIRRGPLDDRMAVLTFRAPSGQTIAAVAHFACHGVAVLSQGIGADIPGELSHRISAALGCPCLFLQGASGDINPTTVAAGRPEMLAWVDRATGNLSDLAQALQPRLAVPFRTAYGKLPLEYAPLPDVPVAARRLAGLQRLASGRAEELTAPDLQGTVRAFKNTLNLPPNASLDPVKTRFIAQALAKAGQKTLDASRAGEVSPVPLDLAAWRLGDTVMVFVAAEVFAATGLRIQTLRPEWDILAVSYLSPLVGYLPDRAALSEGGYEVDDAWQFYGHPAPFQTEAEPRLLAALDHLLEQLS